MFGRKKRKNTGRSAADVAAMEVEALERREPEGGDTGGYAEPHEVVEPHEVEVPEGVGLGPYDIDDVDLDKHAEDPEVGTLLDLGSLVLPVPEGAGVQVEVSDNQVSGVHLQVPGGRITVSAYAAPKTRGQWRTVVSELAESLKKDDAQVRIVDGPWGREVVGVSSNATVRFVGVDGPRWMLRGVAVSRAEAEDSVSDVARDVIARTVVRRGREPMPVRKALPITLPEHLVQQLQAAQGQQKA